jgi:hypothetical protein
LIINRRQFLSLSALIFAPYLKVNAYESSFKTILNEIHCPFQMSNSQEVYNLDSWISKLPDTSNISALSEHILSLIKLDYIENRVNLIDGVILSNTEITLYFAKKSYA